VLRTSGKEDSDHVIIPSSIEYSLELLTIAKRKKNNQMSL